MHPPSLWNSIYFLQTKKRQFSHNFQFARLRKKLRVIINK